MVMSMVDLVNSSHFLLVSTKTKIFEPSPISSSSLASFDSFWWSSQMSTIWGRGGWRWEWRGWRWGCWSFYFSQKCQKAAVGERTIQFSTKIQDPQHGRAPGGCHGWQTVPGSQCWCGRTWAKTLYFNCNWTGNTEINCENMNFKTII